MNLVTNVNSDLESINSNWISESIVEEMISDISSRVDELKWYRNEPTLLKTRSALEQIDGLLDCLYEHAEKINNWRIKEK